MAKDKYTISSTVTLIGSLDYNQNDSLVVYVEKGKGDNVSIVEVPLMDVLDSCVGKRVELKLLDEKDKCNE